MKNVTADLVLIYSTDHRAYWRELCAGYTTDVRAAGTYQRAEAEQIVSHINLDPGKICEIHEIGDSSLAPLTGTVADISDNDLLHRAMRTLAPPKGQRYAVRWSCVMYRFALGSTYAKQLCLRFGMDPDAKVRR